MSADEEIVVTGRRESSYEYFYWDWSSYDSGYGGSNYFNYFDGGGGGGGVTTETPTLEQQAEQFAEEAIEYGEGFDPNNPEHQKMAEEVKEVLKEAYIRAHDGIESSVRGTDGKIITDSQLRTMLDDVNVILQTTNLPGGVSADFMRATNDLGVVQNIITLDIDDDNFAQLTGHFGSFDEAVSFTVLHEMGHAIDRMFGAQTGTEAVANYFALQLGSYLGVPTPTSTEFGNTGYDIFTPATTPTSTTAPTSTSTPTVEGSTGDAAGYYPTGDYAYAYAGYDRYSNFIDYQPY
jgi:hypothetical protein